MQGKLRLSQDEDTAGNLSLSLKIVPFQYLYITIETILLQFGQLSHLYFFKLSITKAPPLQVT